MSLAHGKLINSKTNYQLVAWQQGGAGGFLIRAVLSLEGLGFASLIPELIPVPGQSGFSPSNSRQVGTLGFGFVAMPYLSIQIQCVLSRLFLFLLIIWFFSSLYKMTNKYDAHYYIVTPGVELCSDCPHECMMLIIWIEYVEWKRS